MSVVYIILLFFACMILFKPGFKFFLLWLVICAGVFYFLNASAGIWGIIIYGFIWGEDGSSEETSSSAKSGGAASESSQLYDKIYENGTNRVTNLSNTGYYYSDGKESWISILGEEHRSNGEVVRENAYLPGRRDIYNASGEYIGYEYEDAIGITHRVRK